MLKKFPCLFSIGIHKKRTLPLSDDLKHFSPSSFLKAE
jgi:hypothetical protein